MRAPQPGPGGFEQSPTTVLGAPPPRPPMGQVVSQDRPHERPPSGGRRPAAGASTSSYVRTLAPLVGMSIVVVVLIAGITAWISSLQERTAAPPAPRPAAVPSATVAPSPSAVAPTTKVKPTTVKPKPKAVTPTTKVAPKTTAAPKPTTPSRSAAAKPPAADTAEPGGQAQNPDGTGTGTGTETGAGQNADNTDADAPRQSCTGILCPR